MATIQEPRPSYQLGHAAANLTSHNARTAALHAKYLLPYIQPTSKVLDIGCGPGSITLDFATIAAAGHATGIDYSDSAIEASKQNAVARGIKNCDFKQGDAYHLDAQDGEFDIVHTHQTLIHLQDPVAAVKEMKRVCKPGGVVAAREGDIVTFIVHPDIPGLNMFNQVLVKLMRHGGSHTNAGRQLVSWALKVGFKREEIYASASFEVNSSPEERKAWGSAYAERYSPNTAIGLKAIEAGVATEEEIRGISEGWRKWIDAEDGWCAIGSGEIICVNGVA